MHRALLPSIGLCGMHCTVLLFFGVSTCQMRSSWSYMLIILCREVEGGVPVILCRVPMLQQMTGLSGLAADGLYTTSRSRCVIDKGLRAVIAHRIEDVLTICCKAPR